VHPSALRWSTLRGRRHNTGPDATLWATIAAIVSAAALALLVAVGDLRVLQADGYKAFYVGRWIAHHGIPHVNDLSAVHHGRPWVDGEWLAELIYYHVWRLGGLPLAAILSALSIAVTYMIVAALLLRRGTPAGWTVLFTGIALAGLVRWAFLRAQDLALPLFALLVAICLTDSEAERPGARLLLLPPLLVLWANVHGSVLLGVALAVSYLLWRAVSMAQTGARRAAGGCLGLACLTALAPLATPYGTGIVHYYLEFVGNPAQHVVSSEGRSPAFPGGAFFVAYVPLVLVGWVTIRALVTHRPAPGLLLAACAITGIAAAGRIGNLEWHTLVTALLIAELSRPWLPAPRPRPLLLAMGSLLALTCGLLLIATLAFRSPGAYEANTSLRATGAAANAALRHPCWLILTDNLDAAALEWHDPWLADRIAYDARAELFSPSEMTRWATFESGRSPRWASTIRGYAVLVAAVAFRPGLVERLSRIPGGVVIARERRGIAVINPRAAVANDTSCPRRG
jgi:hypothetical protein